VILINFHTHTHTSWKSLGAKMYEPKKQKQKHTFNFITLLSMKLLALFLIALFLIMLVDYRCRCRCRCSRCSSLAHPTIQKGCHMATHLFLKPCVFYGNTPRENNKGKVLVLSKRDAIWPHICFLSCVCSACSTFWVRYHNAWHEIQKLCTMGSRSSQPTT